MSEKVRKSCPSCNSVLSVSKAVALKAVSCPKCSKTVVATELFVLLTDGKVWAITKAELKDWVARHKLQPSDSFSFDGSEWRKLNGIPGLFNVKPKPVNVKPKPASPKPQLTAPKKLTPPARQPQSPPPLPNPLANPIAVLLNALVTERLDELQEKVKRGEIEEKQFEAKGRRLLEQLLAAIEALPGDARPREVVQGQGRVENSKSMLPPYGAATTNRPAVRQDDQASLAGLESSSARRPEPSGIGTMAKLAGAAILGGAFGYLLANQRVHADQHGAYGFQPMSGGWDNDYDPNTAGSDIGYRETHAAIGLDSDGDGIVNQVLLDQNSDGVADFVAHDNDGDGLIDSFEVDNDLDGTFDQRFVEDPSFAPSEIEESHEGGRAPSWKSDGEMLAEMPEDVMVDGEFDSDLSSDLDDSLDYADDFQNDGAGFDDAGGFEDSFDGGFDMDMEF